jgi:myo-inositol 2-dehydrogenase/D-chiro-inositol 1-dehydrogenase
MIQKRVRIAMVGVGHIGAQHATAVAQSELLELVAVVDPRPEAIAAIPGPAVTRLDSVDALIAHGGVDAVIVAVPSAHHVQVTSKLIDAGLPVLCEKPAGLNSAQVRQIQDHAATAGVHVQVGYWRRFVPELIELHERIRRGEFGALAMLVAVQWDGEPRSAAFRDPRSGGGILVDMGVHEFDMLRWLTGQEIEAVTGFASATTYTDPVEGDPETVNLVVGLSKGTTAVISLARRHPPGDLCRVEVLGGDDVAVLRYLEPECADEQMIVALGRQAEAFAASVATGAATGASPADAVAALDAAERSNAALDALAVEAASS